MHTVAHRWIAPLALLALLPGTSAAQGTLADYRNAEKLLGANLSRVISIADVDPNWIGKSDRFWYLRTGPGGRHFVLVDPTAGTSGPAFDQTRMAAALSDAAGRTYQADSLPFVDFEFADGGTSIRFEADDARWSCSVDTYRCRKAPAREDGGPYESLSPDGRWAAYVQDHDLYVRDTSTGTVVRLTRDGVAGRDYATPLPDLRTLVAQRVSKGEDVREERRSSGRPTRSAWSRTGSTRGTRGASPPSSTCPPTAYGRGASTSSIRCPVRCCRPPNPSSSTWSLSGAST